MRLFNIILLLFIMSISNAQELPLSDVLYIDMLEFKCKHKAENIAEKLWQLDIEVEIQDGYLEKKRRYYIEIQDISILDIEIRENGKWVRYFPKNIKKKLIKVEFY